MTRLIAAFILMATPVLAETHATGDAAAGADQFARQCTACHVVRSPEGQTLAGRNAQTGPNLHGLAGRTIGAAEGYRYSEAMAALGATGAVWEEADFVAYVQNPTAWLRTALGDRTARGKMAYKVRDLQDAVDIYAYLAALAPEPDAGS